MNKNKWLGFMLAASMTSGLAASPVLAQNMYGWEKQDGKWVYYVGPGIVLKDELKEIGNDTYYFNADGFMVTGWKELNGSWYFFDSAGHMKTGWLYTSGSWYYLSKDPMFKGKMITGWQEDAGKYYYLDEKGKMVTGWQRIGSSSTFLDNSGAAKTGWLKTGAWHYFSPYNYLGMYDTWIKDPAKNLWYQINGNGVWMNESDTNPIDQKVPASLTTNDQIAWIQNTPIAFEQQGWIVQINGKYGLIQPDGTWLVKPEYEKCSFMELSAIDGRITEDGYTVQFSKIDSFERVAVNQNGICPVIDGLGGANGVLPVIKSGKPYLYNLSDKTLSEDFKLVAGNPNIMYVAQEFQRVLNGITGDYYLWNPAAGKVFGPYRLDENPTMTGIQTPNDWNLQIHGPRVVWNCFKTPFMVKTADKTWTLYSSDLSSQSDPYASITVTSPNSARAWKDSEMVILDGEGKVEYSSILKDAKYRLSDGAGVIHGKALVKYNGVWYFMDVE